jgi:hypothetical protein
MAPVRSLGVLELTDISRQRICSEPEPGTCLPGTLQAAVFRRKIVKIHRMSSLSLGLLCSALALLAGCCCDDACDTSCAGVYGIRSRRQHCDIEPACFGYHSTCWRAWPADCPACPPETAYLFPADPTLEPTPVPPDASLEAVPAPVVLPQRPTPSESDDHGAKPSAPAEKPATPKPPATPPERPKSGSVNPSFPSYFRQVSASSESQQEWTDVERDPPGDPVIPIDSSTPDTELGPRPSPATSPAKSSASWPYNSEESRPQAWTRSREWLHGEKMLPRPVIVEPATYSDPLSVLLDQSYRSKIAQSEPEPDSAAAWRPSVGEY